MKALKRSQFYVLLLLAGDTLIFILSLIFALYIRNNFSFTYEIWEPHRVPFMMLGAVWILLLLAGDFYNPRRTFSTLAAFGNLTFVWIIWLFLSFAIFYLSPYFEVTPKMVLAIDAGILYFSFAFWRWFFYKIFSRGAIKFAVFGYNPQIEEFLSELRGKKTRAFECALLIKDVGSLNISDISREVFINKDIDYVVTAEDHIDAVWADFFFRELFPLNIKVERFNSFFEEVLQKVPVQNIGSLWFLENLDGAAHFFYDLVKRGFDILVTLILVIPAIFISIIVMMALLIEGKTGIFYMQNRVKRAGGIFRMYKFASMRPDAEKDGPKWAKVRGDERVTKVGRVIRRLHFDELPQLINIIKGDMSFIGPRPERPEFVENLRREIPFYYQRFLVKPGLSGWAQLNYPYGETAEDALKKLQYDLFYIKHRSLLLDLEILLRSFRLVFFQPKK